MTDKSNDNERSPSAARPGEPDAHGQAALLLAESILHSLVATRMLTPEQAVETAQIASEVKEVVAEQQGESTQRMNESLVLLRKITSSLETSVG